MTKRSVQQRGGGFSCSLNSKAMSITETQRSTDPRVESSVPQGGIPNATGWNPQSHSLHCRGFHSGSSGHHSMALLCQTASCMDQKVKMPQEEQPLFPCSLLQAALLHQQGSWRRHSRVVTVLLPSALQCPLRMQC